MNIAVYTKKEKGFFEHFRADLEKKDHHVIPINLLSLTVDDKIRKYDLVILKSKKLFFIYAGYLAQSMGIPVIPEPDITHKVSNRIQFPFIARIAGIRTPNFYMGFPETIRKTLSETDFPLMLKGIVGTGSRDIKFLRSIDEIAGMNKRFYYLEQYISGLHLICYFIENDIMVFEKEPFKNEHFPVRFNSPEKDISDAVKRWRDATGLQFGHLDLVRENSTGELVLVDPGAFPQFTHWPGAPERIADICMEYHSSFI